MDNYLNQECHTRWASWKEANFLRKKTINLAYFVLEFSKRTIFTVFRKLVRTTPFSERKAYEYVFDFQVASAQLRRNFCLHTEKEKRTLVYIRTGSNL
jgi:hypothetical protein